jgi:glycosyltransferase involved in cell wall biosynthesis
MITGRSTKKIIPRLAVLENCSIFFSIRDNTAMKICMLAEKLPPEFTGSGNQAIYLSKALTAKNIQVIGLCSYPYKKTVIDYSESFPIVCLKSSRSERLRSFQFTIKSIIWLSENRDKYDILHVHGYCRAAIPAMLVAKLLGKKTVYKITLPGEDDPQALYKSRFGRIKNMLIDKFDAFVVISTRVLKTVKDFGKMPSKVVMIPNGVDNKFCVDEQTLQEAKLYLAEKYKLGSHNRIISYVGSIEYRKGTDLLAKSWPMVIAKVPEARLFLVGPCDKRTEFYQQLEAMLTEHIGKTVFFVGSVKNPELYYRASDVFVFPSRNESFGNVLVEAMACGTACLAARIEGVTEDILINGYNGLSIEQENIEALADAVINLLRAPALKDYLAENAVRTVKEKFRIEKIAERYFELYQSLLSAQ